MVHFWSPTILQFLSKNNRTGQSKLHPNCIQVIDAIKGGKLLKGFALRPAQKVITSCCPPRSTSHCLPGANRESAGSLILSTFQGSFNSIFRSCFKSIAKLQKTCREAAEKLQYEQRTSGPCTLPICNISFLPLFELPFAQSPLEETHNEISFPQRSVIAKGKIASCRTHFQLLSSVGVP